MATKDYSSVQEGKLADYLGWKVVSGSGARNFFKGDIESNEWLGECKTHVSTGNKIQFKKDVWDKICKEAISCHKSPVLFTDDGSQQFKMTLCLVPLSRMYGQKCIPFPSKIRTNIQFEHIDMYTDIRFNMCSGYVVTGFGTEIRDVVVTTFDNFANLFGRL